MQLPGIRSRTALFSGLFLSVLLLATGPVQAQAQTGEVSGQVTTDTGEPVVAAQLSIVGTTIGSLSDQEGRYTIRNVPAGTHTVVVQRIGYQEQTESGVTVTAGETTVLEFTMPQQALMMEEIVATGLVDPVEGARSPITVARVTRQNMPNVVAGSALQNLQGQVAGVSIARGSGEPGTSAAIQLRSPTSLGAGTPLIVVDGVILGAESNSIESMDIESIEVIKGAAAASLYGSRASNGVISITTARGQNLEQGQTRFSARTEFGFQEPIEGLGAPTHHLYAMSEDGSTYVDAEGNPVDRLNRIPEDGDPARQFMDNPYPGQTYDNVNNVFNPGSFQQHSFSVAQNSASTNFALSINRNVQEGILPNNSGYYRNSFRVNLDHRFLNTLSLGVSAYHARDFQDDADASFGDLFAAPPDVNLSVKGEDGNYVYRPDPESDYENPLWVEGIREDEQRQARTLASAQLRWDPLNWVSALASVSYDREDQKDINYWPIGSPYSADTEGDGSLVLGHDLSDTWNAEAQVSFQRNFGDLNARTTLRGLFERQREEDITGSGDALAVAGIRTLEAITTDEQRATSSEQEIRADGYLLDTALDYAGKYIGTFLVRRDGSSLFGEDERWHTYYRVAGAYRISEEDWFDVPYIDELKISAAQGTAGGRPGFSAQYEVWSVSDGIPTKAQLGNRFLRPSHTTENEVSLELVSGRIGAELAYAWQRTEDQLFPAQLLAFTGYSTQWQNGGTIEGSTIELTLQGQLIQRPNFGWTSTLVADYSDAEMTEWPFACDSPSWRYRCEGRGIYEIWGNRWVESADELATHDGGIAADHAGEFDVNDHGFLVWVGEGNTYQDGIAKDLWGTSTIIGGQQYQWGIPFFERDESGAIRQEIGDASHMNLGWINTFTMGSFSLHAQLQAKVGGDAVNTQHQYLIPEFLAPQMDQAGVPDPLKKPVRYWSELYAGAGGSTYFVEDGTFLKLRQVGVNYRLNPNQLARFGMSSLGITGLQVGLIGRDLFTITDYRGWDPEQGLSVSGGAQAAGATYPPSRSYTAEFAVTF